MKLIDFLNVAKQLTEQPTRYYSVAGGKWATWDNNKWNFDCIILVKAILWEFNFDKSVLHGGAKYLSNNVPDLGANSFFEQCCHNKSNDFSKIEIGELVWLDGHIGIYAGNGNVIEATSAWENGVLVSKIDSKGNRTRNGKQVYKWEAHGKCDFIDYSSYYKYKVGDLVILNGWTHSSSQAGSETTGEYHDFVWTISKIEDGDYQYNVNNVGWVREKYLTPYASDDYKQLYEKELLINKDLQKQVDNLQTKINKAIEDLK